ncbi:MAG: methyltransferase domain-containing protein [Chitinophagaceae bacterium]|nr:methyltransferase domain-containing protein [Chitinophagaceae bacterium]MCW5929279.1 methyltransferase domain-containing protein [Chitinophagaceae bacterium]
MFLTRRSYEKELLDDDNIPFEDIRLNMKELNVINTWLGGHRISIQGLRKIIKSNKKARWHICEIGCGGGDNLRAIEAWCNKQKLNVVFTGIDKKKECIDYAIDCTPSQNYHWIISDYSKVDLKNQKPDIIFSSLFCHHFTDEALQPMMQWMHANSQHGFFINDLHRHRLAWLSIKLLTRLFSKSDLVKNDAPLSVKRGFTRKDWVNIMQQSGISHYSITWKWAFRWLITVQ